MSMGIRRAAVRRLLAGAAAVASLVQGPATQASHASIVAECERPAGAYKQCVRWFKLDAGYVARDIHFEPHRTPQGIVECAITPCLEEYDMAWYDAGGKLVYYAWCDEEFGCGHEGPTSYAPGSQRLVVSGDYARAPVHGRLGLSRASDTYGHGLAGGPAAECLGTTTAVGTCTKTFPLNDARLVSVLESHGNFHALAVSTTSTVWMGWYDAANRLVFESACQIGGASVEGVGPLDVQNARCASTYRRTQFATGTQKLVVKGYGAGRFHGRLVFTKPDSPI